LKPKVLFVIDTLEVGGAEKSILAIASRLTQFEPVVCSIYPGKKLLADFQLANLRVIQLDIDGVYNFWRGTKSLREVINLEKPSIVHATLFRAEVISRWCLRNSTIPLVGSFVNDSYSEERFQALSMVGRLKLNGIKWIDQYTARWVTRFISITNAIRISNSQALGIDPQKTDVIYRGRDTAAEYKISNSSFKELKLQVGGDFTFLSVARLLKRKGLQESIEAFGALAKLYPNARYLIAGEGHDRPVFESLVDALRLRNKVFLLGTRSDVAELLAYADAFIFPSHYEGQGGALIEAMLAMKTIIASDIPVVAETITHNKTGLLFKLRDTNDLAEKMISVLDNLGAFKQLGVEARQEACRRFDVAMAARSHEMLYESLLKNS
jgi:glycosyltransferase involved in cell wall biosynthesis